MTLKANWSEDEEFSHDDANAVAEAINAEPAARDAAITAGLASSGSSVAAEIDARVAGDAATLAAAATDATAKVAAEATARTASEAGLLSKANNLIDIASPATARTNLGLGSAATANTSDFALNAAATSVFNVKDPIYGATGNGITNDAAAIQAADDAAAAAGGTVFFPGTTASYYFTATITKSPKTIWVGVGNNPISGVAGSLLRYNGEGAGVTITASQDNVRGGFKGLRYMYAGALGGSTTSIGIYYNLSAADPTGVQDQLIEDCYIGNFAFDVKGTSLAALYLDRAYLFGAKDSALHLTDCSDIWIQGGTQCSGVSHGIYALRASSMHLEGARPQSSGLSSVYVEDTGFFGMTGGSADSAVIAAGTNSEYGIHLKNVNYSTITGVNFYSNGATADIYMQCTASNTMLTNTITGCSFKTGGGSKKAVLVDTAGTMRRLSVTGCVVDNSSEPLLSINAPTGSGVIEYVALAGNVAQGGFEGLNYITSLAMAGNSPAADLKWQPITADTTLTFNQSRVSISTGSGNVTATLPATPYDGLGYVLKKTASANTATVSGNGHDIDGAASIAMTLLYDTITVLWDSGNSVWRVTSRGTVATPRSGMVRKAADAAAINNNTLVADADLLVPVSANTSVQFRFVLLVSGGTAAGTGDFVVAVTVPTGATFRADASGPSSAATAVSSLNAASGSLVTSGTASPALGLVNSGFVKVVVEGSADIGSTAGNIGVQYSQSVTTASGDVVVKKFSNVTWQVA